jgi:DNA-binding CsgD family transcriptional regulator
VGEAAAPPLAQGDLVARDAERARIDAYLEAATERVRSLVIRGDPGIGKTALWRHAVERGRAAGFRVVVARPAEEEMSLALGGLVDLFDGLELDAVALQADADPLVRGRAVLDALRALAEARPALVAVDDAHWLDASSARALRYALRRLDTQPIAVLTTARAGAPDPLAAASTLPPGRHESLDLGPLGLAALRRVLAGTVRSISRPTLRRIHEVSGGNPLYAIELARGLGSEEREHAAPGGISLPTSLGEAIARRLEAAPAELAPLLELVSALGPTTVSELRPLVVDGDVEPLLALAEREGLLVLDDDLRVRFWHPLVSATVYAGMSPLARRQLHGRLAARSQDPDVCARHLALSTDDPDAEVAKLLEDAAVRASERGASEPAAELARHSLRLTPPGDEDAARRRALVEIEQLASAGEVRRALTLTDRLLASLPPGPARAEALVRRADLEDDDSATAEALLLDALNDAGEDERLRGRVLDHLAQLRRLRLGDVPGAIECAREALEIAERSSDARLELHAAAYVGHLETLAGSPQPELMARAVRLEEELGSPPLSIGPRALLAKHRLWAGDLAGARSLLTAVHESAVRSGSEILRPQHFYDLTLVECAAGELAAADELAGRGIEAARDAENTYSERELLYPVALVAAWLGQVGEARATAARLQDEATRHGVRPLVARARGVLGLLALSEDDAATAAEELGAAADLVDVMGFANPAAFPVLPDAVDALARAGDPRAADLLARLEREASAVDGDWTHAAAQRSRGTVLLAAGHAEHAAVEFEAAAASFERLGFRPDAARSLLGLGRALLRGGQRTLAADTLAEAQRRFSAMGAALWAARAAEELERAAPGRAAGTLTAAERRVAALVAEGRRNREIAQTLFMSVATVEAHLTRIYRKLDIRSRSELARLVAEGAVAVSGSDRAGRGDV